MRLFYDPASTTSRAVTLFVAEAGLDVELEYVGLAQGEHHGAAFAALNPNRQVPVLEHDGFVLTESASILRYLADLAGSSFYPREPKSRALIDSRLDWFNTGFARDAAYGLVYPQVLPGLSAANAEAAVQQATRARQATERWLAILDEHWISERRFVAGEMLTIADFLAAAYVTLLAVVEMDLRPYPNVARWLGAMRRLRHWSECYAAFDGLLAALRPPIAATG